MILKNKTTIIVLIILLLIFTLTMWIIGLDVPSTFTASELISKMADILLKVGFCYGFLLLIYIGMFVSGVLSFIVFAIHTVIKKR